MGRRKLTTEQKNQKFKTVDISTLTYCRPCRKDHHDVHDHNVKRERGCWACECMLPPGAYDHIFVGVVGTPVPRVLSKEEGRKLHVQRQMIWNRENNEKFREYQNRYRSREEVREKESLRAKNWYAALTPEEKKARQEKSLQYYYQRKSMTKESSK